ncbi:putative transposase [Entomortierella parvispora]|uniref:Transposase n=1 Tax=Entomortierella parvispora TaxID=205924 RepID=A0A9P3HFD5_9FUNG|nr:putative transposase [Entomortierella parvispora]
MQATYFGQLRSYYGYHTTKKWEIGHQKVLALINHFLQTSGVPKSSVVLYFDGKPCEEKQATAKSRHQEQQKSLIAAKATVEDIQQRALHDKRISKGLFNKAHRLLSSAYYFPAEIKSNLVQFLIQQGFDARVCSFEADPEIASDCQTHDVVVSRDSDMFAYDTIHTVVVPISKDRFLVSAVEKVMSSLDLSRVQLTTFAITRLRTLGSSRWLNGSFPIVFLAAKNIDPQMFAGSRRVFVDKVQTAAQAPTDTLLPFTWVSVCKDLEEIKAGLEKRRRDARLSGQEQAISSLYPSSKRHGSKQTFNPFRTIDRPSAADVSLAKNRHIKPRYSYHERQAKDHGPTLEAEQYYWKSYQKPAQEEESSKEDEDEDEDEVENDESGCAQEGNTVVDNAAVDGTKRRVHPREQMQRDLRRHHPFVTAKVGCLKANILQACKKGNYGQTVVDCLALAAKVSTAARRQIERIFGRYIEAVLAQSVVDNKDRTFLDLICPRIPGSEGTSPDVSSVSASSGSKPKKRKKVNNSQQRNFLACFARFLISENPGTTEALRAFRERLRFYGIKDRGFPYQSENCPYSATVLVEPWLRTVQGQIQRHYINTSLAIKEKLEEDGAQIHGEDHSIRENESAIENFWRLNILDGKTHVLFPLTHLSDPHITWTDHQLAQLFWYHADLKSRLQEMVQGDFGGAGLSREPTLEDTKSWVGRQSPGAIVKEFVCRIGRNNFSRRERKKRGMKAKIIDANTLELEAHLQRLGSEDFDPNAYEDKGYYLQGSITTNGTKLHVNVFKIRELNMVKYKRLPSDRMPVSPTSTIRGLDYFPSEIRHVFKNEGDVQRYYGDCSPSDITVVGIDPGDRFIVGVHVLLPESASSPSVQDPTISPSFRNLTISQKAAYQPILKHRAWLEEESKKMLRSVPLSAEAPLITASSAISPVSLPSLISPALLQSFSTPSVEGASTSSQASASNAQALSTAATNPRAHTTGPPDPELSTLLPTDAKALLVVKMNEAAELVRQAQFRLENHSRSQPMAVAPTNVAPTNVAPANAAPANAAPANIVPIDAEESIADILRRLPPLHGPQASFTKYMQEMEKVAEKLDAFYGSQKYKKRHWDLKKAMEAEFAIMADRIMKSFGGSIGRRRRPDEKVLVAIGQGGSRYNKGLESMDSTFTAYLIRVLRSLGYVVVLVNEYYTSQKCPRRHCHRFLFRINMRRLACNHCGSRVHRDVVGAHNIANAARHQMTYFTRIDYLQPTDREGNCQWTPGVKTSTPDPVKELNQRERDILERLNNLPPSERPLSIQCKREQPTPQTEAKRALQQRAAGGRDKRARTE